MNTRVNSLGQDIRINSPIIQLENATFKFAIIFLFYMRNLIRKQKKENKIKQ